MEVSTHDVGAMIELAFERMLTQARRLGDRAAERPAMTGANSVSGLVAHGIGVTRWWLAHEVLGDPVDRDRDAEFESNLVGDDLEAAVAELLAELPDLLARVERAHTTASPKPADVHPAWSWTPGGMALHVIEELFQHAGHADLTADFLSAS